ncbi:MULTISPECIES: PepSY domain-containing protein [unclassified Acidovorax]|uniref:PepSY domain-containing protein n=1 Tax=unclassified Acidovorax TaxID=2684926 RepID=UPI0010EC4C5F|nr:MULTISPECIES: PepSY domain-containing protein [unclassified Acidovorax]RYF62187.1 MAG: PepSY domain-containing protein [Comamonadaceae bacterium]
MKKTVLTLTIAAAAAASALPSMAWALTPQEAINVITQHQYVAPQDLQKRYGYWTADALALDGVRVDVLVNDADGSLTTVRKTDIGTALPSVAQVADKVRASGYALVHDVELDDGFWEAEARQSPQSAKVELVLHPVTLEVLSQVGRDGGTVNNQPALGADQVLQALQQAGYTRIHGIEFDEGFWEADAVNTANQAVELRVDPNTGKVLRERLDD